MIEQLLKHYCRLAGGWRDAHEDCIEWAVQRLREDTDRGDLDIALLAGESTAEPVQTLARSILARHVDASRLDDESIAGQCLLELHREYRAGTVDIEAVDRRLMSLNRRFNALWLIALGLDCERATAGGPADAFERGFERLARLWGRSRDADEFHAHADTG
ncbi:hypothetical protein PRJ39_15635 [Lysobacter enzymogenes]|uniref:hypothetical protein n=1 Tax=Lysobacter enzymogenes TaxID=69 RepID=UPI0037499E9F